MSESVGIVNIEVGNLRSVGNAFDHCGFDTVLIDAPEQLDDVTHLVLPGVGSFGVAMRRLEERGLVHGILRFAESGRPLLGLCLGMQLLATEGTEGGPTEGLGLIPAKARRLRKDTELTVPHVGWNSVDFVGNHPLFERVKNGRDFYFVHSFIVEPDSTASVLGRTEYGETFASAVGRNSVVGLQFHPEKSQTNGLRILENFALWEGRC